VGLVFVGEGAECRRLRARANGQSNVRFLPFFPANKISSVLAAADAHLITVKRRLEGVVVPSKMYGILAAGKPIVAVAPPECDVVAIGEKRGFSISADPDDPAEFAASVRKLVHDPDRLRRMGELARSAAPEYERSKELRKFVSVLEGASDRRKPGE
jgi:colanic acid biosynthesis glycosyl transferase WcaI